jgi:hypothetical protein
MSDPMGAREAQRLYQLLRPYFMTFGSERIGTFTPAFFGTGTAGTWVYGVQSGFYTLLGNRCFFNCYLQATSRPVAPTGNARIINLPFTSNSTPNSYGPCVLDNISGFTLSAANVQLSGRVDPGQSYITLVENNGTAPTVVGSLAATGFGTAGGIVVSGHYMI